MTMSLLKAPSLRPLILVLYTLQITPGLLLVTKRLNGDNYPLWKSSMIIALTAKNKIGFVNGFYETPSQANKPADFAL
jgi:hypothetical protein